MEIFLTILFLLAFMLVGYLFGSIPTGVIIGKIHGIDIRNYGSHNTGGTNVGRTLGKAAGITTMILDILKCFIPLLVGLIILSFTPLDSLLVSYRYLHELFLSLTALSVFLGHTFPIFSHFKGGKAVACFAGYILFISPIIFIICVIVFFTIFHFSHRISVCSISTVPVVFLLSLIPMILDFTVLKDMSTFNGGTYFGPSLMLHISYLTCITTLLGAVLIIFRHRTNIKRIEEGKEPETHFSNTIDQK